MPQISYFLRGLIKAVATFEEMRFFGHWVEEFGSFIFGLRKLSLFKLAFQLAGSIAMSLKYSEYLDSVAVSIGH